MRSFNLGPLNLSVSLRKWTKPKKVRRQASPVAGDLGATRNLGANAARREANFAFGPLTVHVESADDDVTTILLEDFALLPPDAGNSQIQIRINPTASSPVERPRYKAGLQWFSRDSFSVVEPDFVYTVSNLFSDRVTTVDISTDVMRALEHKKSQHGRDGLVRRLKNSIFSYNFFWYLVHIALLKKGHAYFHAGVVDLSGEGMAFIGAGGSGKTSLAAHHLEQNGASYLAEDLGIINSSGEVIFSPKTVTIYGSDVSHGQVDFVRYVESTLSDNERRIWLEAIARGQNPRRKVAPRLLFPGKCDVGSTRLKRAYFVNRQTIDKVEISRISPEELCARTLNASFRELNRMTELLYHARAVVEGTHPFPSLQSLEEQTRDVYAGAFEKADTFIIRVPSEATPSEVVTAMRNVCA
jgi:hypothetical protein